jgi:hypothetical protein
MQRSDPRGVRETERLGFGQAHAEDAAQFLMPIGHVTSLFCRRTLRRASNVYRPPTRSDGRFRFSTAVNLRADASRERTRATDSTDDARALA